MFRTLLHSARALALLAAVASGAFAQEGTADARGGPTVRLRGLDGKTYDVASMGGHVVIVSFGATWCAPCEWELVAIEELKEEYKGRPVKFLWVSIEPERQTSDALLRHYAKSRRLTIPVLRDPDRAAFAQFADRVRIPVVVFFDQKGRFVAPAYRGVSAESIEYKDVMRRRIEALLAAGGAEASK